MRLFYLNNKKDHHILKNLMYSPLTKRHTIMADKCPTRSSPHLCSSSSSHMVFVYTSPYNLIRVFFLCVYYCEEHKGLCFSLIIISCLRIGKSITYPIPTPLPSQSPPVIPLYLYYSIIFHKGLERHDKRDILLRGVTLVMACMAIHSVSCI